MRDRLITTFLQKNSLINLSAIRDEEGVRYKHIYDSLELGKVFPLSGTIIDVGTGSGFPLLPLAMTFPDATFIGLDSTQKKLRAVEEIAQTCMIHNVSFVWSRAENHHHEYDVVIARAVAYIDVLLGYSYHLCKPNGYFCFFKQEDEEEKKVLEKMIKKYSLELIQEHTYSLYEGDISRVLYILQKK